MGGDTEHSADTEMPPLEHTGGPDPKPKEVLLQCLVRAAQVPPVGNSTILPDSERQHRTVKAQTEYVTVRV